MRPRNRGVLLIEALIAIALLSSVVVAGLVTLFYAARVDSNRRSLTWLAEFARSKTDEYIVTYPSVPSSGTVDGKWSWKIEESRVWPDGKSRFDRDIALYELAIRVWNEGRPAQIYEDATIMARRP